MSLHYTAASSSRITKRKLQRNPSSASPSPFDALPRRKSSTTSPANKPTSASKHDDSNTTPHTRLEDNGLLPSLSTTLPTTTTTTVPAIIIHITTHMFTPLPSRTTGLSSTKTTEILLHRQRLPPLITTAHLHALRPSPTSTDREIASLCASARLRRLHIPHLGSGRSAAGEALVSTDAWRAVLDAHPDLTPETKSAYGELMARYPTALGVPATELSAADALALIQAGFLTAAVAAPGSAERFLDGVARRGGVLSASSAARAASGSMGAIGGVDAFLGSGGGSAGAAARREGAALGMVNFAMPGTGAYLRLLVESRAQLVGLLAKISPRYREAPLEVLRERWDGGVAMGVKGEDARKERGDRRGEVLPGKTKKWRQYYGLDFRWVLEECVGSGMVELFGTGAVGIGVRAT